MEKSDPRERVGASWVWEGLDGWVVVVVVVVWVAATAAAR
jgi:hypothetical protein